MMKTICALLVVLVLTSCQEKNKVNFEKPKDLIPKAEMIDMLYDMHLAVAASNMKDIDLEKKNYMSLVYEKYGVDSTRFYDSNLYYTSKIQEYEEIFEEVERRLDTITKFYTEITDSIEAVKKEELIAKRKRDSIIKANTVNPVIRN